ncbi:tRNA glutamyl-Q(34) synthetase GluQRS [Bythopirellula goksoeyrii]|uniref:Glutamate--tRNA ligase n=1 Tax=Bythopirellula goksoeyrii TaxID=1400387 RepID=A0A5B9QJ81_9BACT|nr:tRNA glutamyl-Q(34) synthetase GluQRS [Bythopirellula goksoeyrii]QEG37640.1 Glutamate--tRNA ligase [Bythopirellula goksoeyrii]
MSQHRTRLAPSPTGALHLGNARTFLVNWALARQQGWQIVLRIEDLDGPRIKQGAAEEAIDILTWLGLDWDEGPFYQLADLTPYTAALEKLGSQGDIYPCACTRKQIEEASLSAPHDDDHERRYPGTCRPPKRVPISNQQLLQEGTALRLRVPPGDVTFVDEFAGEQAWNVEQLVGDFLVGTKLGLPGYQLAVVVDDARQGITQIVRGDDLLSSTPRQLILYEKLGLGPVPLYTHLPMVVGEDGRRLAKRHGDTRLSYYREKGVTPERILGLLAHWCGLDEQREMTAKEFAQNFELSNLPREQIVYTPSDLR